MTRLLIVAVALAYVAVAYGTITTQCIEQTEDLQTDEFLDMIQDQLYTAYKEDFDQFCDFSEITSPSCDLKFDGDNKTYLAACEDKGGQIMMRDIVLRCGVSVASVNLDLGVAPMCVGQTCNLTAIGPNDLNDTRVEQLLTDLSVVGCDTEVSSAPNVGRKYCIVGMSMVTAVLYAVGI